MGEDVYFLEFDDPTIYLIFAVIFLMSQAWLYLVLQGAQRCKVINNNFFHFSYSVTG